MVAAKKMVCQLGKVCPLFCHRASTSLISPVLVNDPRASGGHNIRRHLKVVCFHASRESLWFSLPSIWQQLPIICTVSNIPIEFSFLSLKIVFFLTFRLAASSEGKEHSFPSDEAARRSVRKKLLSCSVA